MNAVAEKICDEILEFPTNERVEIIDKLLYENSFSVKKEIKNAWIDEVNKRVESIDNGTAKLIPGEEVFARINKRFST